MWKTPQGIVSERIHKVHNLNADIARYVLSMAREIMPGKSIWKQDLAHWKMGNPQAFPQKGQATG
jgi:hypothetical protein